ncbi:MAG: hypothetical protein M1550_02125 [Deltaproteobacteria bacterium]|nr:hypothetical protein [Deltaproteobacteria bacterium]
MLAHDEHAAVAAAIAWLKTNYEEEVDDAIVETYLGGPDQEDLDALHALPHGPKGMLDINIGEWLVSDAILDVEGKRVRAVELVLGPGGPLLPAQGKEWLKAIGENPLGLYEVQDAAPGEGFELKDLLRNNAPTVKVTERTASRGLVKWDIFGARLARRGDGHVLTGAIYPLDRRRALECLEEILDELAHEKTADDDIYREIVGTTIADYWLAQFMETPRLPQVVHASTGDPVSLTVDHYTVTDWEAIAAILSAQPDVDGNIDEGWIRFEPTKDRMRRSRASLTKKSPDTLEVFCPTVKLADEARQWLGKIAGTAIRFKAREIVDPMSPKAMEAARKKSPAGPEIPPELKAQVEREFLRRHYERWPDEPVPALGGKTPKAAVRTKKGRQAVIELLKDFEIHEARKASREGGEPFDFGFLWKRLGLEKERA